MKTKLGMSAIALAALMLAGCGDDGSSGGNGPSGNDVVRDKTITGVAQKGPFVDSSVVIVRELDSSALTQTGRSFQGQVMGGRGRFTVSGVPLVSRYALLEANGRYWNENTGARSNDAITLNALVDLSERENVNINLLTHLESERALHLVSSGMGFAAAKKQAEQEVFKAFGVTGEFANSEELDILAKGEGDAALLAISALMQGDLSGAALAERLADFVDDIKRDGKWDDATSKVQMADWANKANLAAIRAIVEGWSAGGDVPAFERFVKAFWWNEYGLGNCSISNKGEIKQDANSLSVNHGVSYICNAGDWREASVRECDTYGWNAEPDGNVKKGQITEALYKYDSLQAQWIAANAFDTSLGLNGCTRKRSLEVDKGVDNAYYICRNGQWETATIVEYDTYGWNAEADGMLYTMN